MHKGIAAYVAVLVIIVALWYFFGGGFKFPGVQHATTSVSNEVSNSLATTTTTIPQYSSPCSQTGIFNSTAFNTMIATTCKWTGGALGLWVASGAAQYESVMVTGSNRTEYVNQTSQYKCPTLYSNFTAKTNETITIKLFIGPKAQGTAGSNCTTALAKFNSTTVPPSDKVYSNVFNGNFSTGTYTGWTLQGFGFDTTPMNIIYANSNSINCYIGEPWSNANFSFFATSFHCGAGDFFGNITSSLFNATKPYLNFKIVSQEDANFYVVILNESYVPKITAHYDTFNASGGVQSYSLFRNASIPLTTVHGQLIRIRVVSQLGGITYHRYIAVGGFGLGTLPLEDKGILLNESFT